MTICSAFLRAEDFIHETYMQQVIGNDTTQKVVQKAPIIAQYKNQHE